MKQTSSKIQVSVLSSVWFEGVEWFQVACERLVRTKTSAIKLTVAYTTPLYNWYKFSFFQRSDVRRIVKEGRLVGYSLELASDINNGPLEICWSVLVCGSRANSDSSSPSIVTFAPLINASRNVEESQIRSDPIVFKTVMRWFEIDPAGDKLIRYNIRIRCKFRRGVGFFSRPCNNKTSDAATMMQV